MSAKATRRRHIMPGRNDTFALFRSLRDAVLRSIPSLWVLALFGAVASASAASLHFDYDEAGRLVQAVADSSAAQYGYDAAGNLLTVKSGGLSIAAVTPLAGPSGTQVVIAGRGFSATPSANTVRFNGSVAAVTAASANSLMVAVPGNATSGTVSVTVGTDTATSGDSFTVTSGAVNPTPTISAFSPQVAVAGGTITIAGNHFGTAVGVVWVRLNGIQLTVSTVNDTQITAVLPSNAVTGFLEVGTPSGVAVSAQVLVVPPAGISASQTVSVGIGEMDGSTLHVSLSAGMTHVAAFQAPQGVHLGIGLSSLTAGSSVTMTVYGPDGLAIANCGTYVAPGSCDVLPTLTNRVYTVVFSSVTGAAGSVDLTLSSDVLGALALDGSPVVFATNRSGQNARYTFTVGTGFIGNLLWSGSNFAGHYSGLTIYRPDGSVLASANFDDGVNGAANGVVLLTGLAMGTYTVFVSPYGASTGQVGLQLKSLTATGTVAIDGNAIAVSAAAGTRSVISFAGRAGQRLGLGVSTVSTMPSNSALAVSVLAPSGTTLIDCPAVTSTGNSCDLPALPADGDYMIVVTPASGAAATFDLTLSSDLAGTPPLDGSTTTFTTGRVGQNARYTFTVGAGSVMDLAWSGNTFGGSSSSLAINKPDGNVLISTSFDSDSRVSGSLPSTNLTAGGTYTVFVSPYGASTGKVDINLKVKVPIELGTVTADGPSPAFSVAAESSASITFAGSAGQYMGLGVSAVSTSPSGRTLSVSVLTPSGTTLITCPTVSTTGNSCDFPPLPTSGTYTIVVTPVPGTSAGFTLTLSTDIDLGVLTSGGPAKLFTSTARAGQNGRFTFQGYSGASLNMHWIGSTLTGSDPYLFVLRPDGTVAANNAIGASYVEAIYTTTLGNTGAFGIRVSPPALRTGQVSVSVELTTGSTLGNIAVNGLPVSGTIASGKQGYFSFDGLAGQHLGLGINAVSDPLTVSVMGPNGNVLMTCPEVTTFGNSCDLPMLPSSGTYTVQVRPIDNMGAKFVLTLSEDAAGVLVRDGPALTFSTSRVGQNARYSFDTAAGSVLTLRWAGNTFGDGVSQILIYGPDAALLDTIDIAPDLLANGSVTLPDLMLTGAYEVFVTPYGTSTGEVRLSLVSANGGAGGTQGDVPLPPWAVAGLASVLLWQMWRVCQPVRAKSPAR